MKLTNIKITRLFGLFDYDIDLNRENDLTIFTGPNGYGKTTILNIIYNMFNQRFFYFRKFHFELLSFYFAEKQRIDVSKKKNENNADIVQFIDIQIDLFVDSEHVDTFVYDSEIENVLIKELRDFFPIRKVTPELWLDRSTGKQITLIDFISENSDQIPENIINFDKKNKNSKVLQLLDKTNVYLIKEQRLFKKVSHNIPINNNFSFTNAIEEYSEELKNLIEQKQLEAYQIAQEIDASFLERYLECKTNITQDEFNHRFSKLNEKQNKLQKFGFSTSKQGIPKYDSNETKALTVYLNVSEEKLRVYDDLLNKTELFVNILNEKRFSFKSIEISATKGFFFLSSNGEQLNLSDLSSGEQHEVVLLYELLFKTIPNTLILIDEPEISLHVMWQKTFLQDLHRIAKLKEISFVIATHSPQIINDKWELTHDLFNLAKKEKDNKNE